MKSSDISYNLVSCLVLLSVFAVLGFMTGGTKNDDDDSDSGSGGLMQPVT